MEDAYESLSRADRAAPLGTDDLELLARSAYMLGRDDDYLSGLERAHHAYLDAGEPAQRGPLRFLDRPRPVFRGETGPRDGWFAREQRLLERESPTASSAAIS